MAGQPAGMRGKFVWENMAANGPTKRARGWAPLRMQSGEGLCAVLQKYVVQTDTFMVGKEVLRVFRICTEAALLSILADY